MELIIETTRNVVLIVFFASVFEMILPRSSMGRFVQLIMGLFVIVTILTPLLNLKKEDYELNILNLGKAEQSLVDQGFSQGLNLQEESQAVAKETAISNLEKQIGAIVNLVPGVKVEEVKVITDQDFMTSGKISKIFIHIKPATEGLGSVKDVRINNQFDSKSILEKFPEETAQRIRETVSSFLGLDARLIEISAVDEEEML